MAFEVQIFTPSKKKKIGTYNLVLYINFTILMITLLLLASFKFPSWLEIFFTYIAYASLGLFFILLTIQFYTHRTLNGTLHGYLKIDENEIDIDGLIIKINKIESIQFKVDDFLDKSISVIVDFAPKLSQGVDNYIKLKTKDGKYFEVFFRIDRFTRTKELNPFIAQLIKHKAIPFERGIELMQLKTKEEIEELRKIILQ